MYRWSKCPGSVRLSKGIESRSSVYAEEGTQAHDIAAHLLSGKAIVHLPPDMEAPISEYVDAVRKEVESDPDATLLVEHGFDLSQVHPGAFGTADAIVYLPSKKLLQVWDFKYGAGIPVEVEDNLQLQYYALGALLSTNFKCATVESIIAQPRCPHEDGAIRRWSYPVVSLIDFALDVAFLATKTEDPNAELVPGSHCRFCPAGAAGVCPAIQERALALAKEEFTDTESYDPQKLATILTWLPTLESWAKAVREFAYAEAVRGKTLPGWKVVEKRATRKWRDPESVPTALSTILKPDQIFEQKLRSPAQIEKIAKKIELDTLTVSISSGYTLVPESDKRPAAAVDAKSEFERLEQLET